MLYYIFDSALGDAVLGSLDIRSVLKLRFSFNRKNCITQLIYKILNNKTNKEWISISKILLAEEFIREFRDRVHWIYISYIQKLSEKFIREFRDRVKWGCVSLKQKLSEDFIREFRNIVNWYWITRYQNLSIRGFHIRVL